MGQVVKSSDTEVTQICDLDSSFIALCLSFPIGKMGVLAVADNMLQRSKVLRTPSTPLTLSIITLQTSWRDPDI